MRTALAATLLLAATPTFADEPLPSRPLIFPPFVVQAFEPLSFDLIDVREEQRQLARNRIDVPPHSLFVIKRHVGVAGGYDNGVSRGSVGLYLTVAEWGRWNFGVPSPEFGFGRYPVYDARRQQAVTKSQSTVIISLASVHYRVGYLRAYGVNWYINLEQVYDLRENMAGSQIGVSFSTK